MITRFYSSLKVSPNQTTTVPFPSLTDLDIAFILDFKLKSKVESLKSDLERYVSDLLHYRYENGAIPLHLQDSVVIYPIQPDAYNGWMKGWALHFRATAPSLS